VLQRCSGLQQVMLQHCAGISTGIPVALASKPGMRQLVLRGEPAPGAAQLAQVRDVGRCCGCDVLCVPGGVCNLLTYIMAGTMPRDI
jgi:hypothetical protein